MDISIFLGRVLGIYLIFGSVLYFTQHETLRRAMEDFFKNAGLGVIAGIIAFIIGLMIVVGHNVWELSWRVLITLIGYLSVLKGLVWFYSPESLEKLSRKLFETRGYMVVAGVNLILGGYLLYSTYVM